MKSDRGKYIFVLSEAKILASIGDIVSYGGRTVVFSFKIEFEGGQVFHV